MNKATTFNRSITHPHTQIYYLLYQNRVEISFSYPEIGKFRMCKIPKRGSTTSLTIDEIDTIVVQSDSTIFPESAVVGCHTDHTRCFGLVWCGHRIVVLPHPPSFSIAMTSFIEIEIEFFLFKFGALETFKLTLSWTLSN